MYFFKVMSATILALSVPSTLAAYASIKVKSYDAPDNDCSGQHPISATVIRQTGGIFGSNGCTQISTQPVGSVHIAKAEDIDNGVSECYIYTYTDWACQKFTGSRWGPYHNGEWQSGCTSPTDSSTGKHVDIWSMILKCD